MDLMDRSGNGRCAVPCLKGTCSGRGHGLRKERKESEEKEEQMKWT